MGSWVGSHLGVVLSGTVCSSEVSLEFGGLVLDPCSVCLVVST